MYAVHRLLWDIRRNRDVEQRFRADPDDVLDDYAVDGEYHAWMKELDFKSMYEHGVNPYLLYFCAIQLGVDRAAYYAQIRGERS
jgi:hypothetical protein